MGRGALTSYCKKCHWYPFQGRSIRAKANSLNFIKDWYFTMINKTIQMVFAFILAIVISLPGCSNKSINKSVGLPKKLGDLNLTRVIHGNEAARVVNKLHGKNLGATDYLIGYYGADNSNNILYLSVYENKEAAKMDLMNMAMKMRTGSKVFKPLTTIGKMGDNISFKTEGMGLAHYFYRDENRLLWWQVEPDKAEITYNELLSFDFSSVKPNVA